MPDKTVNLVDPDGVARQVPEAEVQYRIDRGWRVETPEDAAGRVTEQAKEELYGGVGGAVSATAGGILRGATGGLSDVALRATGGEDSRRMLAELQARNQAASIGGEVLGTLLPTGAGGLAAKAGGKVAGAIAERGIVSQLARAGARAGVEGAVLGAGQGVSEVALSEDPVTLEHAASVIGSSALFGGATGGAVGVSGKVIGKGLARAKAALDDVASKGLSVSADVAEHADDLRGLDRKGLRAAETTELEAIEAARVPKRAELADEIKAFRQELKANKPWLATQGAEESEIRAIGARTRKADRALDNVLDDPKALAESPKAALKQLRVQEAALDDLVTKHSDTLRAKFAGDTSGARAAALDYASVALEKNRSLQTKIAELSGPKTSARLDAIAAATDALSAPKPTAGMGDALGDLAMGHVLGAAAGIPYLGPAVVAAKTIGRVVKKLGVNTAESAARASKAVQTFLDVGARVAPKAPMVASKVLSAVRFGESDKEHAKGDVAGPYRERTAEIRQLTAYGPDGKAQMRPDARAKMAEQLAPVRAANPVIADRIETTKARGVEFLASVMPKKPDVFAAALGHDTWQPSNMEMRSFARSVAAVEDPHGVIERLADGSITPEDVEAMKAVYPEMHADITRQIIEQLGELQAKLPYQRRLALSIFSGVAVDPAMDPRILNALQAQFELEEGSAGGTQAPVAQPAFGSVSKPKPTAAQERAG